MYLFIQEIQRFCNESPFTHCTVPWLFFLNTCWISWREMLTKPLRFGINIDCVMDFFLLSCSFSIHNPSRYLFIYFLGLYYGVYLCKTKVLQLQWRCQKSSSQISQIRLINAVDGRISKWQLLCLCSFPGYEKNKVVIYLVLYILIILVFSITYRI